MNSQGINFFSLKCNWESDMKIFKAKFGLEGIGFIISLWQTIYRENGYYYYWDEDNLLLFCDEHNISEEKVNGFMEFAFKKHIFSPKLFKSNGILTSKSIQNRYFFSIKRRKKLTAYKHIILIEFANIPDFVNIIEKNVNKNGKNVNNFKQSKVKDSKVKDSKVKYIDYVFLKVIEYNKLKEKYGKKFTDKCINVLNNYKGSSGKTYKSDYMAILSWVIEKGEKEFAQLLPSKSKMSELGKKHGQYS